jgi:hypothetical protein
LNHFVVEVARSDDLKRISTLAEIFKCLVDTGRHRVFHLVGRLLLTLPVSMASVRHSFSSLKIIKERLRNKMEKMTFWAMTCWYI